MYTVHFSAFDKAGNVKTSRKLILYDNLSIVTINNKRVTRVETASANTNFTWVSEDTTSVLVKWTGRFMNERHTHNMWLALVNPYHGIETAYDDHDGRRTVDEVPNVQGTLFL